MKILNLVMITFGLVLPVSVQASAKVFFSKKTHSLNLSAHIYFYGVSATPQLTKLITDEINLYWNGGSHLHSSFLNLQTQVGGGIESFNMEVTSEIISEAMAFRMMANSPSPEMNFIRLLPGNTANGDRSYMDQLCGNTGTWFTSDQLDLSTTAAHEFGHGLCLEHPNKGDLRGTGQPPMLAPRGTLVDPQYQWNPSSVAGQAGGTLNPFKRRVIQADIDRMPLDVLNYDANGIAYLRSNKISFLKDRIY
jgi:hypothetical protein